ncbi:translation initiation factor IF-2-like [Grus americana]|uniref:translation initiation factor IF-2-like n=1 Tax=Grus americana TaxID=9117 RepID=UPI0024083125|nr:translation initiation factor IF-2-like [Grus americana]
MAGPGPDRRGPGSPGAAGGVEAAGPHPPVPARPPPPGTCRRWERLSPTRPPPPSWNGGESAGRGVVTWQVLKGPFGSRSRSPRGGSWGRDQGGDRAPLGQDQGGAVPPRPLGQAGPGVPAGGGKRGRGSRGGERAGAPRGAGGTGTGGCPGGRRDPGEPEPAGGAELRGGRPKEACPEQAPPRPVAAATAHATALPSACWPRPHCLRHGEAALRLGAALGPEVVRRRAGSVCPLLTCLGVRCPSCAARATGGVPGFRPRALPRPHACPPPPLPPHPAAAGLPRAPSSPTPRGPAEARAGEAGELRDGGEGLRCCPALPAAGPR